MIWAKRFFFLVLFFHMTSYPNEAEHQLLKKSQLQVSEDLAHVLWHVMKTYDGEYKFEALSAILSDLNTGKIQTKSLDDCYASLMASLERKATENNILNLQIASSYLQKFSATSGANELVKHKLYYKIIKPGIGNGGCNLNSSPLISFREKTLHGEILSEYISGIRIPLSETILGFQKGMEGIKLGEQREIVIHPDLAYGEFPKPEPYSLIIIEVTLLSL